MLRNAVVFTTAQRATAADRLLIALQAQDDELERAFLAVDALQQMIQTSEDTLGWMFVLHGWKRAEGLKKTLFALLDTVRVGASPWTEEDAIKLLDSMDDAEFRRSIAHLPADAELRSSGWTEDTIDRLRVSVDAQKKGLRRTAERRAKGDRAIVKAYNKSKHMPLAMPVRRGTTLEVDVLTASEGKGAYSDPDPDGFEVTGAQLSTEPSDIRLRAEGVITMQASLCSLFLAILKVRFNDPIPLPPWVLQSLQLEGWLKDDAAPRG